MEQTRHLRSFHLDDNTILISSTKSDKVRVKSRVTSQTQDNQNTESVPGLSSV
jgi:hypothetical protein